LVLTDQQIQVQILNKLGDLDSQTLQPIQGPYGGLPPNGAAAARIADFWSRHEDKTRVPGLRELCTALDCCDLLIGQLTDFIDSNVLNFSDKDSQQFDHRKEQRANIQRAIELLVAQEAANRTPVVGTLTAKVPNAGPDGLAAASHERFGGSPYYPTFGEFP
jgi:hypothetical protein